MNNTKAIVTGSDSTFFILAKSLILSLLEQWHPLTADIYVLDFGLSEEEIRWFQDHQVTVESGVDISRRLNLSLETPQAMAVCLRAYLPRILPGYRKYLWMDADCWVQDPIAVNHYFHFCDMKDAVAAVELDRTYNCCYVPGHRQKTIYSWFKDGFEDSTSLKMSLMPVINCGVFSAVADSSLWDIWPDIIWETIHKRKKYHMADQTTFNYLVYEKKISCLILPAEYNWLILFSRPAYMKDKERFMTPVPPHSTIKIIHLAGMANRETFMLRIASDDGRKQYVSFLYTSKNS